MTDYRALLLEHGPEAVIYEDAIRRAGCEVFVIRDYSDKARFINVLDEKLTEVRPDLVVSDAFFPSPSSHHAPGSDTVDEYILNDIIAKVRDICGGNTVLVALSKFSSLLLADKQKDLDAVDFIWDKMGASPEVVQWQVTRLRETHARKRPNHVLCDVIHQALLQPTSQEWPWREHVRAMITEYKRWANEAQQVHSVYTPLKTIATEMDCGSEFTEMFDLIIDSEQINIVGRPDGWGHLRHVINVFWLGYYILNSQYARALSDAEPRVSRLELNRGWFLAALLHDYGLAYDRLPDVAAHIAKVANCYAKHIGAPVIAAPLVPDIAMSAWEDDFASIQGSCSDDNLSQAVNRIRPLFAARRDHGVMSAIALARYIGARHADLVPPIRAATLAAVLHNAGAKEGVGLQHVDPSRHPIASLLMLADVIEAWDRETGWESSFKGKGLESVELKRLAYDDTSGNLTIIIDYLPYRNVLPDSAHMDNLRSMLLDTYNRHICAGLNKSGWAKLPRCQLSVEYRLAGRNVATYAARSI